MEQAQQDMDPTTSTPPPPDGSPPPEPTVLDWVRSILRRKPIALPVREPAPSVSQPPPPADSSRGASAAPVERPAIGAKSEPAGGVAARAPVAVPTHATEPDEGAAGERPAIRVEIHLRAAHLRFPIALLLALVAQLGLERKPENLLPTLLLYALALVIAGWAAWEGDLGLSLSAPADRPLQVLRFRPVWLGLAGAFSVLTLLAASNNTFRTSTLVFWFGALVCMMVALWDGDLDLRRKLQQVRNWLAAPRLSMSLDGWAVAVVAAFALVVWFRFSNLASIPGEMVSDHAEKLLDMVDVLNGQYSIFFPRNTGREALQFYLAAATASLLGTGVSFMTLKIGTALAGVVTLPFVYLFARELGGRKVALAAMFLAGIAYWPNVISRIGLRFALYPLFAAPALYFLVRGLRSRRSNDLLWCGLIVGLGLHGYTPRARHPDRRCGWCAALCAAPDCARPTLGCDLLAHRCRTGGVGRRPALDPVRDR